MPHSLVMLCYVMLCYVMLCYVMLCYVMLCYVMLCYVMLCYVMLCYVMLCYVMMTASFNLLVNCKCENNERYHDGLKPPHFSWPLRENFVLVKLQCTKLSS